MGYYRVRGIHQYQNCCNPLCGTIVKNYEICLDFIVWQIWKEIFWSARSFYLAITGDDDNDDEDDENDDYDNYGHFCDY